MAKRALADLKVVELGQLVSAPFCAKMLADLGAEVIKVEEPGGGDEARRRGPFPDGEPDPERSGLYHYLNANKMGVTLNLNSRQGLRVLLDLLDSADVFVENNPPQLMHRLGLDYESLKKINPRLVVASMTPFGQTGPYRDHKAGDLVGFHMGGFGYVTPRGREDGRAPLRSGERVADFMAGLGGAVGTMCALFSRVLTGLGQHVDLSTQEMVASALVTAYPAYSYFRQPSLRAATNDSAPLHILPCKDGHIYVYCSEEYQWQACVELMGEPEWTKDPRFADRFTRGKHWHELKTLLSDWLKTQTKQELFHAAQAKRAPFAPANSVVDMLDSEHEAARGYFIEVEHPAMGKVKGPGAPYKFSETPWSIGRAAPLLGEHNEQIYTGRLGYSEEDVAEMKRAGII